MSDEYLLLVLDLPWSGITGCLYAWKSQFFRLPVLLRWKDLAVSAAIAKEENKVKRSVYMKIILLQGEFNVFQVFKMFR